MKLFKEMIEKARSSGIRLIDEAEPRALDKHEMAAFWDAVERCEVFVFNPTRGDTPESLPETWKDHEKHTNTTINKDGTVNCPDCQTIIEPNIDAPFPVVSYEILDGKLTSSREREYPVDTLAVMAVETSPKQYIHYALMRTVDGTLVVRTRTIAILTERMMHRLQTERDGVEKVREKIKIGSGSEKRFHTVRRIIHVCPKKEIAEYEASGRTIDFSHRFSVRGHWRELGEAKLGKDRNDDYCVTGWTWVKNYVKGPKDKPLVTKVRVVDDGGTT